MRRLKFWLNLKKIEFTNNMDEYLKNWNINFVNMRTKTILIIGGRKEIFSRKIIHEIKHISNNAELFEINHFSVIILNIILIVKSKVDDHLFFEGKK